MIGGPSVIAGLDVGTTKTCAVIVEAPPAWSGEEAPTRILGVGLAPTEGVRNRTVTRIDAATESIRDAVRDAELMAGREVEGLYVAVAGDHIGMGRSNGVVVVADEEVSQTDLDRVHEVARAVALPADRELLHAIPLDYAVDGLWGIQDPLGMAATRLEAEAHIISGGATPCQNLRKAVDRAGYRIEELVLAPLASHLAVVAEPELEAGVALVELGGSATDLVVFRQDRLRLLASIPWGAITVANDIVKGLGVPMGEAERLKDRYGAARAGQVDPAEKISVPGPLPGSTRQVSRELLAHIIEQRLDEIFGLVYQELEEVGLLGGLPGGLVLSGGGASLPGTVELAQEVFNTPVRLGVPGEGLNGLADAVRRPKFATAVGLALYGRLRGQGRGGGLAGRAFARVTDWLKDFF
ncbi:MAG: cell division protein FtsA [Gemmatimonadota bacterium]